MGKENNLKPRCDLCRSPVLLGGDRGVTRWYQSLYQEDVGELLEEVKRLREALGRIGCSDDNDPWARDIARAALEGKP